MTHGRAALGAATIAEAFRITAGERASEVAIRTRGDEFTITWGELRERVRALGGNSAGSLGEFLELARNKESSGLPRDAQGMVGSLLAAHEALIRNLRSDLEKAAEFGDAGTNDFLTGLMEQHEKMAWMLRATLERG